MLKLNLSLRKILIKYFFNQILFIYKIYYRLLFFKKKEVIVVYTPGKVASSSVYKSLKNNLVNSYVFHLHFINEKNINDGIELHKRSERNSVPLHFINSIIFKKYFLKKDSNIKFIIIFRDEIKRYISDYYQNIDRKLKSLDNEKNKQIIKNIISDINNGVHLEYPRRWIKSELNETFNLHMDFNQKQKKYFSVKKNNYDFFFFNLETIDEQFSLFSKSVFGKDIKLFNSNRGSNKSYNKFYNEALKVINSQINAE